VVATFGILAACFFTSSPPKIEDLRAVLEVILAPVVGIVGAVTGFYFGSGSATPGGSSGGNRPL
jgi:hypothetical protein